jgi:hypothetical protein
MAEWGGGLWLALIGWFVLLAAREGLLQMSLKRSLGGLVAKDVMIQDFPSVPVHASVQPLSSHWWMITFCVQANMSSWWRIKASGWA